MVKPFYRNIRLLVLTIVMIVVWGFVSFQSLPRQEDPELVSRVAVVQTAYPGANAERVEALVTEVIEAETDLVRAGQLVGATALQSQKAKHAETYVKLIEQAKNQGATIKALSPSLAEKLVRAQNTFKATLQIGRASCRERV